MNMTNTTNMPNMPDITKQQYLSREPVQYTKKQKLQNWLYYNKWWLVVGAVILWIAGSMIWNILGIGKVRPDYIFAYVGGYELPDECAEKLKKELATLGADINGDGKVTVELRQYPLYNNDRDDDVDSMYYAYASDVTLVADITEGESFFFILEDPASFQLEYQTLADPNGFPPDSKDFSTEGKAYLWSDCPALDALNIGEYDDLMSGLYIGRRCFYNESKAKNLKENEALWEIIISGIKQ